MVKIKKASPIGFCFGVRRAVDMAENALNTKDKIYSLGPVIHNALVVKKLSQKGIKVISDIKYADSGNILIRSHGIKPSIRDNIKNKKLGIIDATCPFVERSHRIVDTSRKQGFHIIIVGEKRHPEIVALSEAAGLKKDIIINLREAKKLKLKGKRVVLIAQTTLSKILYRKIIQAVLDKNIFELRVFDTICNDVVKRQNEVKRLGRLVDMMIVIGGKNSANTKRLVQLCRAGGVKTYHVESEKNIKENWLKKSATVGIISGSSTPKWAADRVIEYLKKF